MRHRYLAGTIQLQSAVAFPPNWTFTRPGSPNANRLPQQTVPRQEEHRQLRKLLARRRRRSRRTGPGSKPSRGFLLHYLADLHTRSLEPVEGEILRRLASYIPAVNEKFGKGALTRKP
jgi:hypothetical protein